MASIYIENYGCTANYDDGAIIAGILLENNHSIVKDVAECDVVIINSCAVKNITVNRVFYQIKEITNKYKDKKLIITGCMPNSEKDKLDEYVKKSISLVSPQNIIDISDIINKVLNNEQVILTAKKKVIKLGLPKYIEDNKKVVSIQISSGCKSYCTFCSTKLAKGNLISYPKEKIVEEVKSYINKGFNRINLTSTDNGCYGFDLGYNLADLINEVVLIEGNFKVRIGMGNPQHIKLFYKDLITAYKNDKILKFLHIPIQSGSDRLLKDMKRVYTIEEFKSIINDFRNDIPKINISTDIIVGYPTETEEDFNRTIDLVNELKFEVVNISKFASRPGTYASKLKQLSSQIIKDRSIRISNSYNNLKVENKNSIKLIA